MSQPEYNRGKINKKEGAASASKMSRFDAERKFKDRDRSKFSAHSRNRPAAADASQPTILLKTRAADARSLSPAPLKPRLIEVPSKESFKVVGSKDISSSFHSPHTMSTPVKLLNQELIFQDALIENLSDNPDFLVIGCVGLQWSGKSTVLSHLASSNSSQCVKQTIFNISSSALQMKGETGTIGLDAYITDDRIIWLDCQPLMSAAIAEIAITHSKDAYKENMAKLDSLCIGTSIEVQSLQLLSFLYCICHILIVVQDSLADPFLIRLLQTAEMLKPNLSSDDSSLDHMPHLVTLYNRGQPSDLVPQMLEQTRKFYRSAFEKSRLHISNDLISNNHRFANLMKGGVNFVPLLDWKETDEHWANYTEVIPQLKKVLLSLPRYNFGPSGLTEKSWLTFANKAWEAVRKSSLMMEYARLLQ